MKAGTPAAIGFLEDRHPAVDSRACVSAPRPAAYAGSLGSDTPSARALHPPCIPLDISDPGPTRFPVFVGHYSCSFAAKRLAPALPLWLLFLAVQFLDVVWSVLVLLGIEKVRIVPGITATNPLDLYYMPYTHALPGALLLSVAGAILYGLASSTRQRQVLPVLALAIFSHWVLDFVVHRPDLPLYDNTAKVGLGLWNRPTIAFGLEAGLLFLGMALYLRAGAPRPVPTILLGAAMLAIQAYIFFGPPPASGPSVAVTAGLLCPFRCDHRIRRLPGAGRYLTTA